MLHISDVEKRLKRNPEPKEVTEMRERITEAFANLEFFEEPHTYTLHKPDGTDIELHSVSSVVEEFAPKIDWEPILDRKSEKEGIDKEVLRRQWQETNIRSTSNGSKTHLFGESAMLFVQGRFDEIDKEISHYQLDRGYLVPYVGKENAVAKFYTELLDNDNVWPVMPEARIYTGYNDTFTLKNDYCGTFDMLFAARGNDGVIRPFLADWKTNKALTKQFNRDNNIMMLEPFTNMVDEPLSHYTLQLSLYSMGLEQLGYKMTHRIIVWLKDDGTYEKIPVPDVSDVLKKVL
jgi:hypothetical protein